jgi:beta-mannosidase
MEHHQRCAGGNAKIFAHLLSWFRAPADFDSFVYLSQVLQGIGMQTAVEAWRRLTPWCMGTIYWQLNDCWPVASWSSIDYRFHWKALHYFARRFYAPLLVSVADDGGSLSLWLTNDGAQARRARWDWSFHRLDGRRLAGARGEAELGPCTSRAVATVSADRATGGADPNAVYLRYRARAGAERSGGIHFLVPYKRLDLPRSRISVKAARRTTNPSFTVRSSRLAPFVALDAAGVPGFFSDNYFHLEPGEEREVVFYPERTIAPAELRSRVHVRSLRDSY